MKIFRNRETKGSRSGVLRWSAPEPPLAPIFPTFLSKNDLKSSNIGLKFILFCLRRFFVRSSEARKWKSRSWSRIGRLKKSEPEPKIFHLNSTSLECFLNELITKAPSVKLNAMLERLTWMLAKEMKIKPKVHMTINYLEYSCLQYSGVLCIKNVWVDGDGDGDESDNLSEFVDNKIYWMQFPYRSKIHGIIGCVWHVMEHNTWEKFSTKYLWEIERNFVRKINSCLMLNAH